MEAGPSSSSSSTRNTFTRTLTTYYAVTNEEATSQGTNDQEDATRAQHNSFATNLLGKLVSQQEGARVWRDVMVWEGRMGKGKSRMIVDGEQEEEEEKEEGVVSSTTGKERAHSRFHSSSTSTLLLPNTPSSPTYKSYTPRLPPPPTRGDLQWIPDVPILEWGEPPTVEEELPSQEEKGGWWFENEGRLSVSSQGTEASFLALPLPFLPNLRPPSPLLHHRSSPPFHSPPLTHHLSTFPTPSTRSPKRTLDHPHQRSRPRLPSLLSFPLLRSSRQRQSSNPRRRAETSQAHARSTKYYHKPSHRQAQHPLLDSHSPPLVPSNARQASVEERSRTGVVQASTVQHRSYQLLLGG